MSNQTERIRNKKSYRNCSVYGCLKNTRTDPNTVYFSISKCPEKHKVWLKMIDREDLLEKNVKVNNYYICESHFERKYFVKNAQNNHRLRKDAIPTLNLPNKGDQVTYYIDNGNKMEFDNEVTETSIDPSTNGRRKRNLREPKSKQPKFLKPRNVSDVATRASTSTDGLQDSDAGSSESSSDSDSESLSPTNTDVTPITTNLSGPAFQANSAFNMDVVSIVSNTCNVNAPTRPTIISISIPPSPHARRIQREMLKQSKKRSRSKKNPINTSKDVRTSTDQKPAFPIEHNSALSDSGDNLNTPSTSILASILSKSGTKSVTESDNEQFKSSESTDEEAVKNLFLQMCDKYLDSKFAKYVKVQAKFDKT